MKTIVLDLDETLIHCNDTGEVSDFKVPITFPND
jgi:predicted HAD superfamily phosphohydrolase YqeG